jgi:exodeoxyribonuclease V beta subunit
VQAYADANPGVRVQRLAADADLPPPTRLAPSTAQAGQAGQDGEAGQAGEAALAPPAVYSAAFDRQWAIGSYSALLRDRGAPGARAARTLREDEPGEPGEPGESGEPADTGAVLAIGAAASAAAAAAAPDAAAPWHRFPRGALAGNFLHGQLEWLAGEGFQLDASPALQQALAARCERQGHGARADEIVHWLRRVCSRVLPGPQVALSALAGTLPEMEFWFPVDGLAAGEVDRLCRLHILPGRPRPALPQRALVGMLMGFADLVFEHQGRCWVLDYKSNALGGNDADYTPQAMAQAMLEHRYDVQAAIYLLALHRLLRARRGPAYAPAQELGGALYLFLRGIETPGAGSFVLDAPLALLDALDTLLAPVGGAGADA